MGGRCYYSAHCTDEETETWEVICLRTLPETAPSLVHLCISELKVVMLTCNTSRVLQLERPSQEDLEFKFSLSYIVSSRLAWAVYTQGDPVWAWGRNLHILSMLWLKGMFNFGYNFPLFFVGLPLPFFSFPLQSWKQMKL